VSSPAARTAVIVAAAGESRRFGSPKMLARFRGEPLLRATVRNVMRAGFDEIIVVIGPDSPAVRDALDGLPVRIAINHDPSQGLGSSIAEGVRAISADTACAVVVLGDQPTLDANVAAALREAWQSTGAPVVVPEYRGQRAPPVLFSRSVFPELGLLRGETGGREVVGRDPARVHVVAIDSDIPPDIDTPQDLANLGG
jgi:molybdenum cofactor cytidylyltransferase